MQLGCKKTRIWMCVYLKQEVDYVYLNQYTIGTKSFSKQQHIQISKQKSSITVPQSKM